MLPMATQWNWVFRSASLKELPMSTVQLPAALTNWAPRLSKQSCMEDANASPFECKCIWSFRGLAVMCWLVCIAAGASPKARHTDKVFKRDSCSSRSGEESAIRSPPVRTCATPFSTAAARNMVPTKAVCLLVTCTTNPPYQPLGLASNVSISLTALLRGVPVTMTGAAVASITSHTLTFAFNSPWMRSTV